MFNNLLKKVNSKSANAVNGSDVPEQASATDKKVGNGSKKERNKQVSDEELQKYTGMNREQIKDWGKDRPDVAGNQLAGKIDVGPTSGLGGVGAAYGYGGWGWDANGKMKFPPKPQESKEKQLNDSDDD